MIRTRLFIPSGKVSRGEYLGWGLVLLAIKYNLDRFISSRYFGRTLESFLGGPLATFPANEADYRYGAALVFIALPFMWVGLSLTVQRLRALGWPLITALLFFVPFVNLLAFVTWAILPDREEEHESGADAPRWIERFIPDSQIGCALFGVFVTSILGTAAAAFFSVFLQSYSAGLFLGAPFVGGFISSTLSSYHERRSFGSMLFVSTLAIGVVGLLLIAIAVEGAICVVMALPLALGLAWLGALLAYLLQERKIIRGPVVGCFAGILPVLCAVESRFADVPPRYATTTVLEIAAPPETVWENVVTFSEIPPPSEAVFATGIAYPVRARIEGRGVGAVRYCEFSTGAFVEPITVWNEPRELSFTVEETPPPMEEWSPYGKITPAHLHGFFESKGGRFLLEPTERGTRVHATTWYEHRIFPAHYWKQWADALIERIHLRVLRHIANLSERADASRP